MWFKEMTGSILRSKTTNTKGLALWCYPERKLAQHYENYAVDHAVSLAWIFPDAKPGDASTQLEGDNMDSLNLISTLFNLHEQ